MDSIVKARFYQVENVSGGEATLFDCLQQLWRHPNKDDYEEIFGGIRVRMERYEDDANIVGRGFVDGEFVRQQTDNIPPIAPQGAPLQGHNNPLGHRCAFRYHPQLNVLLLESRREAVTPIRIDGLIKARLMPHRGLFLSPVLSETALDRLRNGTPRKVTFRVARPADMQLVEGDDVGLEENLARFQNVLGGPNIEVSSSWPRGDKEGVLNQLGIGDLIRWASGNRDHVEKLTVKLLEEPDAIDIFSEQLKVTRTLTLNNNNVDLNYQTRRQFLAGAFDDYLPVIRRLYTP